MWVDASLLFLASFGAATILPGSSEVVLYMMIQREYSLLLLFLVATAGNYLGALLNWYLGRIAGLAFRDRLRQKRYEIASRWFSDWGHYSLLLSWVPVVGDPLTFIAGWSKIPLWRFSVWVVLGKGGRYAAVIFWSIWSTS